MKFNKEIDKVSELIHLIAIEKGWWEHDRNDGEMIALMHSELSEALEAIRKGNPPSIKAKGYSSLEEELADVVIRIFDYCYQRKLNLAGAMKAKIAYNSTREYKHGGKKF